ncbi:MAG TPA: hypothetical protein VGU20_06730 [Stellaceae bacterium]|nr:hypothetical protein [Stellaceae bacterium]
MPRPRKTDAERRSATLSVRVAPDLHERLRASSEKASRTISQEIELRLRGSFDPDHGFGGRSRDFARLVADGIEEIERTTRRSVWEDAFAFDEMRSFVETLMRYLRPKGRGAITKELRGLTATKAKGDLGKVLAQIFLAQYQIAARGSAFAPEDHPRSRRALAGFSLFRQLGRAGRSPLDEMIKVKAESMPLDQPEGQRRKG